ncbi:Putative redox-active protein domain-containing [Desulfonema limicola]|uniref:Redox-active protein domain-containing n=1 Tax=Desulfonema limicola TaxID=45656 RepID=A0A975B6X0_9BACT|nr:DV_1555 family C-GCAxxG-C-C protein [Desulfonema limicola]QTA79945.1 Putative redox-active protein domain-containing [Desulfonema limicola]
MDETMIRMMQLGGKGYSCSQIILQLALEMQGEENPELIRAMSGLAYGCGAGTGTCGALTGGCCLIGLYAGKGRDEEQGSDQLMLMLTSLSDWFIEKIGDSHGSISCEAVTGGQGPAASAAKCGEITAKTYEKALEILAAGGFDLC